MPDMEKAIKGIQECDLNGGLIGNCPYKDILSLLKEQDAVVLCKDCRHCTFSDGEQLADCMIKQGWFPVKPDWFCADGVPKEGR